MTSKLDDILSKWPLPQQTQLEADEAAERVVATIQAGQLPASMNESLLAAPLPKTNEDEQTSAPRTSRPGGVVPGIAVENKMSKDRTRDRTSFQELAKLAQTTPPPPTASGSGSHAPPSSATSSGSTGVVRGEEASSSDSGIVDLKAIASADPSGSQRAQTTPLAASGLFDDESAPPKPAVSAQAAAAMTAPAASAVPQSVPSVATPSNPPKKVAAENKKGGGVVIVIGALVAAASIAAGGVFFVKWQRSQHAQGAQVQTTVTAPDKAGDKTPKATTTATGAVSVAQADTQGDSVDTNQAQTGGAKPTFKFHSKPGAGGGAAAGSAAPLDPAAGGVDPKLVANLPTGPAGGGSGDLSEAMRTAAGGGTGLGQGAVGDQGTKVAAGNVPQRPSQGQVAGAVGSVMPSVKACLGSDDPVSRAVVTFQSDGTVKSVNVTGFAAGKPQEACIKGALSKATVAPFAEATYPMTVTIRPN